ncbi:MAG: response regulator transcription factor [Deltaproteobacteria bacterium]|nr:response regulator transcription factor [Deltaproteobacteria bacterium]
MEPIRILLVDDHPLFRHGVAALLEQQPDMEVVGEAGDGQEAIERAAELMPDVILMDVYMPRCDGLEATRRIKEAMPYVKIVILTVSEEDHNLFEAIKAGAQGYLLKRIKPAELFEMLRGVSRGEAPISRATATKILHEFARQAHAGPEGGSQESELTRRERDVLELLTGGATNKEIASALFISENTVRNHLRNILEKLHLQNRVQAATYALRQGLVSRRGDIQEKGDPPVPMSGKAAKER